MTETIPTPEDCPRAPLHGTGGRNCPSCSWTAVVELVELPPDPFYDETSCPIAECEVRGQHTHDNDDPRLPLNRDTAAEWATARGWIYLAVGETCLDCSSTALVGHWHTGTDCLVARTGWGGP